MFKTNCTKTSTSSASTSTTAIDFKSASIHDLAKHYRLIRRHIHQHPELSFDEYQTTALILQELKKIGFEDIHIHQDLLATGLVVEMHKYNDNININNDNINTKPKKIMLRADIDALPLQELNTFEHASKNAGKMHACGHDGHTAILLCALAYLYHHVDFNGTVYAVFQPAEEHGGGAKKMIEAGLFRRFTPDFVFALHNWPGLDFGTLGLQEKALMASSNEFHVKVLGRGGHAAIPDQASDCLLAATHMIQSLQSVVARNVSPLEAAVLSVTYIHGGEASNIIADQIEFGGTVRTFNQKTTDLMQSRMQTLLENQATAFDCQVEFEFTQNYPPTENHSSAYELLKKVADKHAYNYRDNITPTMGAEDFAFMLREIKGAYFFLGNGLGEHHEMRLGPCQLHNPHYDFNDDLIQIGAQFWCDLIRDYLN